MYNNDKNLSEKSLCEESLEIEIIRVKYYQEHDSWAVLVCFDTLTKTEIIATGYCPKVNTGEYYILKGVWSRHKQYGRQFKFSQIIASRPKSTEAMIKYLSSNLFKGIGEKTAIQIVDYFKHKTIDILDHKPDKLIKIPGLGSKKIAKIQVSWNAQSEQNKTLMFLYTHGFKNKIAQKIIHEYKDDTIKRICENPYLLCQDISGIGFITADKIALSLGFDKKHPQRLKQGVIYLLMEASDKGHCFLFHSQLIDVMVKTLSVLGEDAESFLKDINNLEDTVIISKRCDKLLYTLIPLYIAEQNIARKIQQIIENPFSFNSLSKEALDTKVSMWLEKYLEQQQMTLSSEQIRGVKGVVSQKVFVLTGGPGVGKTTVSNVILKLFKAMGKEVTLVAPTGRAAKRLSELTQKPAKTIHRLLEWSPKEMRFLKDHLNPILTDVMIIDESSMIDIHLASKLLDAISLRTQVVFIGDVDQLPPVGPGNLLNDLISSNLIPCVRLIKVYRQSSHSNIITFAHKINCGITPDFLNTMESDCHFMFCQKDEEVISKLEHLISKTLPKLGYDINSDVQVLVPMNKGTLGSLHLNLVIQKILNSGNNKANSIKKKDYYIFKGDKVIQQTNNYDLNVFNGDIGYISCTNVNSGKTLVSFNSREVEYEGDNIHDLSLAYAITIHKSQGSEFPVVIIPVAMQHYLLLQRNLIYTALTRAKKLAIFIGDKKAFNYAVTNDRPSQRQSHLIENLKNVLSKKDD